MVCRQITGSTGSGAEDLLSPEQIAENALKSPERVLLLNGAFILLLLAFGATAFQFLSIAAFSLLTGFILAAVVVLNAFYLRTIDKLDQEPFQELIKLALLKFFAPLARRRGQSARQTGEEHRLLGSSGREEPAMRTADHPPGT